MATANGAPQIELSTIENATIKGVGNVTNLQTWVNTFISSGIAYGVGHGVITTADGRMAIWTGSGIGRSNMTGVTIYHDVIFYNTANSTGSLAFLKNLEGLSIAKVDGNKETTKIWEWK